MYFIEVTNHQYSGAYNSPNKVLKKILLNPEHIAFIEKNKETSDWIGIELFSVKLTSEWIMVDRNDFDKIISVTRISK